jgi:glycosyltransferase involved in cell wall biosynthesis
MKILQVTKKFPYPFKDGESLAIVNMAKGLESNGAEVSLLAMNTLKHYYKEPANPKDLSIYSEIEKVTVDNRFKWTKFLFSFWSKDSFLAEKYLSNGFKNAIINILSKNEFDVIQLESIFLAPYIPIIKKNFSGLISLRTHNVESLIWERMAKNANFLNKWIYSRVARKLKQFEIRHLKNPDLIIPISKPDNLVFIDWGVKVNSKIIPVGIDSPKYNQMNVPVIKPLQIGFIGALDWLPNIEGLDWFLKLVWKPFNLGQHAHLNIAGRNMPETIKKRNLNNVTFHGEIPSAIDFMMNNQVLIVPLLSGSGMRVKILEGMALGKVIVTSTLGAEGIPINNGENIIIADTPTVYAEKIIELATHYDDNKHIGIAAKSLIHSKFSNKNLGRQLISYYQQQLIAPLI